MATTGRNELDNVSIQSEPETPMDLPTPPSLGEPTPADISLPDRFTQVVIVSDTHPSRRVWNQHSESSAAEFCASVPGPGYPAKSVMIVEEINEEWTRLLRPRLPASDADFIQQHFTRLDATHGHEKDGSVAMTDLSHHAPSGKMAGFHLDGIRTVQSLRCRENASIQPWSAAETGMSFLEAASAGPRPTVVCRQSAHYRHEIFIRISEKWEKTTTRISCCELHDGLYLILVDAPLGVKPDTRQPYHELLQRRTGDGLTLPMSPNDWPNGKIFRPLDLLQMMFRIFTIGAVLESISLPARPGLSTRRPDFVLHWLLVVTAWESLVGHVEHRLTREQHHAATAIDMTTFTALSNFRRQLADTREGITNARAAILFELEEADSQLPSGRTTRVGSDAVAGIRRIEVSTLPVILGTLEKRLDVVGKILNEEIQLLIGSVQVRDSETAKEQAERATMLTLLAAVYLPLQLVTGIFGMNIAEINDGVPEWRACVIALAIAGGLTLVVFVGVRWWRKRRLAQHRVRERAREKAA